MTILFLVDNLGPKPGGKERRIVEILKVLSKDPDYKIVCVIMNKEIHYKEIFSLPLDIVFCVRRWKKDPLVFLQLYKICRQKKVQIIHAWDSMTAFYGGPIAKICSIKLINSSVTDAIRFPFLSFRNILNRFNFLFSDLIISNSAAGFHAYNVPQRKGLVIRNGFNFQRIENLKRNESNIGGFQINTRFIVGMVAAFEDRKDYFAAVAVANRVLAVRRDVTFMFIGAGKNLEVCRASVLPENAGHVVFTGAVNNVEEYIELFSIGLLLSNKHLHAEGISNSILEYMAMGKPVLATDTGGTNEIVRDGLNGYIFRENSVEDISTKICKLLDDENLRLNMGNVSKSIVVSEFTIDSMMQKYREAYVNTLAAH